MAPDSRPRPRGCQGRSRLYCPGAVNRTHGRRVHGSLGRQGGGGDGRRDGDRPRGVARPGRGGRERRRQRLRRRRRRPRSVERAGGRALASPESVATMAGGRGVVDAALKTFGDLHIVVCCAGILRERMIFNMSEEEWDAVIAVHLKGHFSVMRPASAHMREKKAGCMITFTSTAGLEGSPGQPNYAAAKEGIV